MQNETTTRLDGIYDGVMASEHTGKPVHRFHDGLINGTPQSNFAFPTGERVGLTETRLIK